MSLPDVQAETVARTCRTCGRELQTGERTRCRECKLLLVDSERMWGPYSW